jgi:hypothetical protein
MKILRHAGSYLDEENNKILAIAGSGGKIAGGTIADSSLVINNVNEFDAESYQCAVVSTLGTAIVLDKSYAYVSIHLVLPNLLT